MKKFNLILRKDNFSEISFPMNLYLNHKNIIKSIVSQVYTEILKITKTDDTKIFIIGRFKYTDGSIVSLHNGQIVSLNNQFVKRYSEFVKYILDSKSNDYSIALTGKEISHIFFNFFIVPKGSEEKYSKWDNLDNRKSIKAVELEKFNVNKKVYLLPANNNYISWGTSLSDSIISIKFQNISGVVKIEKSENQNKVTLIQGNDTLISFIDYSFKDEIFIREFDSGVKFYIKDSKVILMVKPNKTEFIKKLEIEQRTSVRRIGTLDIETIVKDGVHTPYLFAFYDGLKSYSWFENDSAKLFDHILNRKYYGYTIYAHNLSRFDIVFLFKHIAQLSAKGFKVEYVKKDDKIISIKIINIDSKISITLKDSILLLPISLAKLAKQFNLEKGKLVEPVYIGESHEEYKSSDLSHYNKDIERIDDFNVWKNQVAAYCIQDCVALYDVLVKFSELIFDKFSLDINKYPTTPSLAFAIYRTHYIKDGLIPVTKGNVYNFVRGSYTGGSTEMYKPNAIGKEIYCYDVNSLYPSVMAHNMYPTGQIFQFEGDPTILNNTYWIGEAKVETKKDLYQPYLQIHHKTKGGMRTVAPNGKFNMIIHSTEYENAIKDYNISVSNGYLFGSQSGIFLNYVLEMYKLRQEYTKDQPMNLIAKLLLNSLYGRFGMQPQVQKHLFTNFEGIEELSAKVEIVDYIEIDNDLFFVTYAPSKSKDLNSSAHKGKSSGVSVSIASAVTAYARIYMSSFKNNPNFNLYYTDTDSIFIDSQLPASFVNNDQNYKLIITRPLIPKIFQILK